MPLVLRQFVAMAILATFLPMAYAAQACQLRCWLTQHSSFGIEDSSEATHAPVAAGFSGADRFAAAPDAPAAAHLHDFGAGGPCLLASLMAPGAERRPLLLSAGVDAIEALPVRFSSFIAQPPEPLPKSTRV